MISFTENSWLKFFKTPLHFMGSISFISNKSITKLVRKQDFKENIISGG